MTNGMVSFLSELTLRTRSEGGRKTPILSGFRTDIKFSGDEYRVSVFEFDKDVLFPGESCAAICTILLHGEDEIDGFLLMNKTIVADGAHIIGDVILKDVINRDKVEWSE